MEVLGSEGASVSKVSQLSQVIPGGQQVQHVPVEHTQSLVGLRTIPDTMSMQSIKDIDFTRIFLFI